MKKYKKWLKKEVSENVLGYPVYYDELVTTLIDQLDDTKKWLQDNGFVVFEKDKLDAEVQRMIDETYKAMNEKPVIPKFVADWIDAHNLHGNNPLREYRDLESDFNEGWTDEKDAAVYHWVNENPYTFIDALRYGYEVEKEKKYYVVDSGDGCILQRNTDTEYDKRVAYPEEGRLLKHIIAHNEELLYQFTEQEIKDYDERYWAFAEEVTQ